jgi:predicted dehydrogenase
MTVYKVAIVGLGIGRAHLEEAYSKLPDLFEVVALCDLNSERLQAVGREFGVPRLVTGLDEVLAMPDVDIVDICTPPSLHLDHCLAVLAAGKHVICEKPLVGSLAQMDVLERAEQDSKGRVLPIFQYRWGTGFLKARELVRRGLTGRAYVASCETHWQRGADYYQVAWRGKLDIELGGILLSQAIHLHDMMCELMGPVERVYAEASTRVNPIEVEDCVAASLKMANGSLVSLSCTLGAKAEISRLKACFEHVTIESAYEPYAPGNDPWQFIVADSPEGAAIKEALAGMEAVQSRFHGQLIAYHAALSGKGEWPVTLADARRSLELITALYDSASRHQPVSLPIAPDHRLYADWRTRLA